MNLYICTQNNPYSSFRNIPFHELRSSYRSIKISIEIGDGQRSIYYTQISKHRPKFRRTAYNRLNIELTFCTRETIPIYTYPEQKRNLKFSISLLTSRANHARPRRVTASTWTVETVKYWGQLGESFFFPSRSLLIFLAADPFRRNFFIAEFFTLSNESPDIYPLFFNISADRSATTFFPSSLRRRNIYHPRIQLETVELD